MLAKVPAPRQRRAEPGRRRRGHELSDELGARTTARRALAVCMRRPPRVRRTTGSPDRWCSTRYRYFSRFTAPVSVYGTTDAFTHASRNAASIGCTPTPSKAMGLLLLRGTLTRLHSMEAASLESHSMEAASLESRSMEAAESIVRFDRTNSRSHYRIRKCRTLCSRRKVYSVPFARPLAGSDGNSRSTT